MTNISLDHYVGREVEDVTDYDGEGSWQVELQGGVRIINYDENYDMPDKDVLVGLIFQSVTMNNDETVLFFGNNDTPNSTRMQLSPIHYGIADSERAEGVVRPQKGGYDPEADRPDEPIERLAEVEPETAAEALESAQDETDGEG